jgi:hypothetical protein
MSLSKSKCWYSNNCLHFLKCAVPLEAKLLVTILLIDTNSYKLHRFTLFETVSEPFKFGITDA